MSREVCLFPSHLQRETTEKDLMDKLQTLMESCQKKDEARVKLLNDVEKYEEIIRDMKKTELVCVCWYSTAHGG